MAVYRDAKCKLCRREGSKLFLKGEKCYMEKCPFNKRPLPPGQHGAGRKKISEYGQQLREKQKTKRIYGVQEGQFRHYYEVADRMKGITGRNNKFFEQIKTMKVANMPKWLEFDPEKLEGKVLSLPTREDVDSQIAEHMIVELYSK